MCDFESIRIFFGAGSVTEILPDDFRFIEGSATGSDGVQVDYRYNKAKNELTIEFANETTVTYIVVAETAEQIANSEFSGTWGAFSLEGDITGNVTGDTTLTLATPAIDADTTSCVEFEMVKLIVTGVPGDEIKVESSPLSPHVIFKEGVDDTPIGENFHGNWFNDTIDVDGVRKYAVEFNDTGTYTIKVTVQGGPRDGDYDTVDITVSEKAVIFDVPCTVIIGKEVKIKGTISAGDRVDILIEDGDIGYFDDEPVDEYNEFEVKWDTTGLTSGTYTIDVYIDCDVSSDDPADYEGIDEDGKTSIRLVEPGLTAEQLRNVTAESDNYTIEGIATGVDDVDIVLIGPNGYPLVDPGLDILNGLEIMTSSVTDDEFSEDIVMTEGLYLGTWKTMVFSPGHDAEYGDLGIRAGELADIPTAWFAGKSQDQIVALLKDHTVYVAGSDDLLVEFTFEVESPYVRLNPIEAVAVGEPLEISGATNRMPETTITISTFAGPADLPAVLAGVEWPTPDQGIFSAILDTTYAVAGTYTLEADDGNGNMDTATVEILRHYVGGRRGGAAPRDSDGDGYSDIDEMLAGTDKDDPCDPNPDCAACLAIRPPTPSPMLTPTPKPTVTPTPTMPPTAAPPTPTPTQTPTPPGFEAVFTIAGLLAVAYLVLRRKRK